TQRSVVIGPDDLPAALAAAAAFGPALVQEYVDGRELAVGFVGERALPVSEIDFSALPAGAHRLVSYAAKWDGGSVEDLGTRPVCPAPLTRETAAEAERIARAAWRRIEGRGYGRVDLRLDHAGRVQVIEVNPNPDLAPSAGLARMADAAGLGYSELVAAILAEALR
ncbi:MAG: D-alanine--D-alanine ligase family protein, partial [Longimicrobiales bacterium]